MPVKTFRGKIADGGQDTIVLHTNNGSTGYRIVKFELMPAVIADGGSEHTCKISKVALTTIDNNLDFSDQRLLAAGVTSNSSSVHLYGTPSITIFDQDIFNQDIYISQHDNDGSRDLNYYIELEQISLDLTQNTVATLKDIRNLS
tara:strand:+ start:156 stop:590 length:435 start_codon:yes stop_codon:yes gene_type:complete